MVVRTQVGIVMVGIGKWKKYTVEAIDSISEFNPGILLCVVDNGSDIPYPMKTVRLEETVSYARAINIGVRAITSKVDWLLILNNDVVCRGNIAAAVAPLQDDRIYGNKLHKRWGRRWIDGWLYLIPMRIWDAVGEMDPNFKNAAFEDADYCFRAAEMGYPTVRSNLPFEHLETMDRKNLRGFDKARQENYAYLLQKHGIAG